MFAIGEIGSYLGCRIKSKMSVSHFAFDSRDIKRGSLFFALKGYQHDGHTFLKEVAQKGGVGAVVSRSYVGPDYGLILFHVDNVLEALQMLAHQAYLKLNLFVIGVTGSVGKTTTKDFISSLLQEEYRVAHTPGNHNTQISLPFVLLNQKQSVEILVLEMGMSHPGEIKRLVAIAPPDWGVLTKVSLAHSAEFSSLEAIAQEKATLFSHPKTKRAFLHSDTLYFQSICHLEQLKCISSAKLCWADYFLKEKKHGIVLVERGVESPLFNLPFSAMHLYDNFLLAASVARAKGLSFAEIARAAQKLVLPPQRLTHVDYLGISFIDDSYNASPASMHACLDCLPQPKAGKKRIGVLASMQELGIFSECSHYEIGKKASSSLDHLICLGQEAMPLMKAFKQHGKPVDFCHNLDEVREALMRIMEPGDVVLIKGSRSHRLWTLLSSLSKGLQ